MSAPDARRALMELARRSGLQSSYLDVDGRRVRARTGSIVAILRALGMPLSEVGDAPDALRERLARPSPPVDAVTVSWNGRLDSVTVRPSSEGRARIGIVEEDAERPDGWVDVGPVEAGRPTEVGLGRSLPIGYHRVVVESGGTRDEGLVIAAPLRAPRPRAHEWGIFAPVHALRSRGDWGVGSVRELGALRSWLRDRGGTVLATLPMLAQFLDDPLFEPSPYSPASRLFWNELYLDVEELPELRGSPEARAALDDPWLRREIAELRGAAQVDHRRVMSAKRRVLEPLAELAVSSPTPAFRSFLEARPQVRDYARFRSEVERRRVWWGAWPPAEREGELSGKAEDDPLGRYHLFVQFAVDRQLEDLTAVAGQGLYLDLPLGVHPAGFDAWRERRVFVEGVSAGAPADPLFTGGQDWGFRPLHPDVLREDGYRYPIACVRHLLRHATLARIDHVMGVHRLFWVPAGRTPADGVYVRYRPEEWFAMLSLEAHRAGAVLVGEDLGTVPARVRQGMARHGVLRNYVVQYEAAPVAEAALPEPPTGSAAAVNTHDMPPFARFWRGGDVQTRVALGLLDDRGAAAELEDRHRLRDAVVAFLVGRGLLDLGVADDPRAVLDGCLAYLAASPAPVVIATLEDLWGEDRPQNVPGTTVEHPNWRRRMRHTVEELAELHDVTRALELVDGLRKESTA